MIVLQILEAYFAVAGLLATLVVAGLIHFRGGDPLLLDGRGLRSVLDDDDRARRVRGHLESDRAPDLFAVALEEIRGLPERRHR